MDVYQIVIKKLGNPRNFADLLDSKFVPMWFVGWGAIDEIELVIILGVDSPLVRGDTAVAYLSGRIANNTQRKA